MLRLRCCFYKSFPIPTTRLILSRLPTYFLTILFICLGASLVSGRTLYVAPHGSNSGSGSLNSPLGSLTHAVRVAKAGDTIILRGGVYTMHEVWLDRRKGMGGSPKNYLTIKAKEGEEPVLRPGSRRFIIHADYVHVEGLHFLMPWRLEAFGRGLRIINNKFSGPQPKYGAIEIGGGDIVVEGNEIEITVAAGNTRDHGIYVHRGQKIRIRNNRIVGTNGYGIHLYDEHKSAKPATWRAQAFVMKDYVISGNFVGSSRSRSGIIVAKGRGGQHIELKNISIHNNVLFGNAIFGLLIREGRNIEVYNNTFYLNRAGALLVRDPSHEGVEPASDVTIKNNIFVTMPNKGHVGNKSPGKKIILENNLYDKKPGLLNLKDANPIIGSPQFRDLGADDFRLKPTSPGIDAGVDVGLPYHGTAPDLGAFEFEPTSSNAGD